ncbi:MAG: hypothetical protein M0Z28_23135 [Rhodospirillales bacterium]|nr:hypothetical protein [Rhodospirillales bacterium]
MPGEAFPHVIFVVPCPLEGGIPASLVELSAASMRPDRLCAILTHDAGRDWPDPSAVALASNALGSGGAAIFAFETLADAAACRRRLALAEPARGRA